MIQEIAPFVYENEYHHVQPEAGDFVIGYSEGEILFRLDEETGEISYPCFEALSPQQRQTLPFTYLFSISGIRYFLCRELSCGGFAYHPTPTLRQAGPKHLIYGGMVALQLGTWYENNQFCGKCGNELIPDTKERMLYCVHCGQMVYPRINPCVIVGVIHGDKILVTKYPGPDRGYYALVAGFAEIGETIEETVHREVLEETGVRVKNLRYYKCQPWPFSSSLLFGFFCELDGDDTITIQKEELALAKWITREELVESNNDFALTNEMLCVFKEDRVPGN